MVTYNIEIKKMFCVDTDTQTNYVVRLEYAYKGVDGEYSSEINRTLSFEVTEGDFIAYADLTQEIVTGWITDSWDSKLIDSFQKAIDKMIELQKNPPAKPTEQNLPW